MSGGNTGRLYELTIKLIPKDDIKQTGTFGGFLDIRHFNFCHIMNDTAKDIILNPGF